MKGKYEYIVYNCGYYTGFALKGKVTGKRYSFKKRMVTKVDPEDGVEFCKMNQYDVNGSCQYPKDTPVFMPAEDWCAGKEGTIFGRSVEDKELAKNKGVDLSEYKHNFDVDDYISKMLVEE